MDIFWEQINSFINKDNIKQKIIVIYWPTWSWKTNLSIDIAKNINSEIISTDSRQIFIWLDIWTWKITKQEMQWIKHYMIDIIKPSQLYSVGEYKKTVQEIINNIHKKWKIPILVWWTWLYIDSLIYDFNIPKTPANLELRTLLEKEYIEFWKEYIFNKLKKIDSKYASIVHPNNINYIIRWIEVKTLTWKSKIDFITEKKLKYDTLFLTPYNWNRKELYEKINKRILQMFEEWLIEEVKKLLKIYDKTDFWLKTIWYSEVIDYLDWKITKDECIKLVQQHNRNYAKRQLTWFKKYS